MHRYATIRGAGCADIPDISPILPPFESLGAVSYTHFIVTMAVSLTVYEISGVKKWRDLENSVIEGQLKMAPFDRPYTAIVHIALSCTIFELFGVEIICDLEIWVTCYSRLMKLIPFESLGAVSYSPSIVTMVLTFVVCVI